MEEALTAVADAQVLPASGQQQPSDAETDTRPLSDVEVPESDVEGEGGQGGGEQQPEPELAEVDYDGKKYKLPPELKDALLRQQDYTRKTQEVAEERKAAEARRAEADQAYQVSQEVLEARAAIMNIDGALKQYENVNWQQLEQEDPVAAMSHWRQYQQLQQQRGQVAQYLDKTQNELSEKVKLDTANRLRETRAFAEKSIPGWSEDMDKKITDFALSKGFSREELTNAYSPKVYEILFLAHLGHQALAQKPQAKPQAQVQKPLETVQAKASPAGRADPAKMPMDEFAKWINKR